MLTEFDRFRPFGRNRLVRAGYGAHRRAGSHHRGRCGLSLALDLKERGIGARVYERAPEIKPLGVGITLLPHAIDADQILEYPMIDKDPINRSTFGRVTLAGDAAHPMYPRGSNGAAQAAIDARTLADYLRGHSDPRDALQAYEAARAEPAAKVVCTNREHPPDFINIKVEELVGDKPFDDLDKYITQDELRALSRIRARRRDAA